MRTIYRVLAYLVAALVAVQAAAVALGFFGLLAWISGGSVLDKAAMESDSTDFAGAVGFAFHGMTGMSVIPIVGLLLLVASFFTKAPGATRWALVVVASIVGQDVLGLFAHDIYWLGALHGAFAFVLFTVAVIAGRRQMTNQAPVAASEPEPSRATADVS